MLDRNDTFVECFELNAIAGSHQCSPRQNRVKAGNEAGKPGRSQEKESAS